MKTTTPAKRSDSVPFRRPREAGKEESGRGNGWSCAHPDSSVAAKPLLRNDMSVHFHSTGEPGRGVPWRRMTVVASEEGS